VAVAIHSSFVAFTIAAS